MKTKLKFIAATFVGTTVFWCLVIVGLFWFSSSNTGVSFRDGVQQAGFHDVMMGRNTESQPVTFTVAEVRNLELRTNGVSGDMPPVVLLERLLPPSGQLCIGIKKSKIASK